MNAAISTVTTLEAGSGSIDETEKENLFNFLNNLQGDIKYLKTKDKLLLWGIRHCSFINKVYGKLSLWSKSIY